MNAHPNTHTHKRLCVQVTVTSTQLLSSPCFYLLSICTPSPQQPQQTQQAWNLIPAGTSLSHTRTYVRLSTTASTSQCQASSPASPAVHLCLSTTPVIPGCLSGAANPHRIFARLSLPLLLLPFLTQSPSLSPCLSLSRFPVAHAAETLYLIHYNTSRLTPSQMGDWLLLVLAN